MKDEIKEILDIEKYRNKDGYVENINLSPDEIHKLLDYITNLQEKNEKLNLYIEFYKSIIDKYKEVLDKIKEKIKTYPHISYASVEKVDGKRLSGQLIPVTEILELLEEIK